MLIKILKVIIRIKGLKFLKKFTFVRWSSYMMGVHFVSNSQVQSILKYILVLLISGPRVMIVTFIFVHVQSMVA